MTVLLLACLLLDEGLWPYNQFPAETVRQQRQFEVTPAFLDHLRASSVRIGAGSGAFVSPRGLILTNWHVVASCASERDGFTGERKCPDLSARVLTAIEDVTPRVKGKVAERAAAIAKIEKECGGSCEVVKLFSGGRYDLYRYKTYSDVRLVFAPEYAVAFFGRERDSITYLRYGMDAAFLRAYENGKPAETPEFLKWSTDEVKEGDLVFAAGNPQTTARSSTAAQLTFYRDTALPLVLNRLGSRIEALNTLSAKSEENRRAAEPVLTALLATYKVSAGKLIGLRDDLLVGRKTIFDNKIRHAVERDPSLGMAGGKVWDEVATAYKNWAPFESAYQIIEGSPAPGSTLFRMARAKARGEEVEAAPRVNEALETAMIASYLDELQRLGDKDAPLKQILGGKKSQEAAAEYVKEGEASMARLVTLLEPAAKRLRKKREETIGALEASGAEKIAQYRFKLFGAADYPDATATPRVEFGVVKAYTDRAGVAMPFAATFSGLFYRVNNAGPYAVPKKWVDARAALKEVTTLDFVSTCDIGSGDAGAPVVNRAGELVGITFDGNLESLPDTYLYTNERARAVHVAAHGIAEALRKVYKSPALLNELGIGPD